MMKEKVLSKVATHQITESDLEHMLKNLNPQIAANFQGEQGRLQLSRHNNERSEAGRQRRRKPRQLRLPRM